MVGRSQLAAPMMSDGVVLSQPQSRTTPSIGLARTDARASMLTRWPHTIAVGRPRVSPSDVTGNSNGPPPASQIPRLTCSAITRKCALHGVSSDHVLQMPTIGRPSNTSRGSVRPIQLRWMNPSLSRLPNQARDRNVLPPNFSLMHPGVYPDANAARAATGLSVCWPRPAKVCQYLGPMTPLRPTRARYVAVAFAMLLAIIQYLDRVCISQAGPAISRELGLSNVQMGWV